MTSEPAGKHKSRNIIDFLRPHWKALALALLAPIIVNILLYHALLWPHGFIPAIVVTVLEVVLVIAYHRSFAPLFVPDPPINTSKP